MKVSYWTAAAILLGPIAQATAASLQERAAQLASDLGLSKPTRVQRCGKTLCAKISHGTASCTRKGACQYSCAKNYSLKKSGKKVTCVKVKPVKLIAADTVYTHAAIYTVDDKSTSYPDGALATYAGRIVWIGKAADVASKVDTKRAIIIDVQGHAMTPSFIDAHLHVVKGGTALLSCDLNYASLDLKGLRKIVQKCVDDEPKKTPKDWLLVASFDRASFLSNQKADLTAAMLDTIKTDRPIFVQTMDQHSAIINTLALHIAGIDNSTENPSGGTITRDANGVATGALEDAAQLIAQRKMPSEPADIARFFLAAHKLLNSYGVTAYHDAASTLLPGSDMGAAVQLMQDDGTLTVRPHFATLLPPELTNLHKGQVEELMPQVAARMAMYDDPTMGPIPTQKWRHIKLVADGVQNPPSMTAAFLKPYNVPDIDNPGHYHPDNKLVKPYYNQSMVTLILETAHKYNLGAQIHTIGDASVKATLDGIADLSYPIDPQSLAIAHAEFLPNGYIQKFKQLNLSVIPTPHWSQLAPYWKSNDNTYDCLDALGAARIATAEPWGLISKATGGVGGNELAVGTDWPVDAYDSFLEFKVAITRTGDPLNPHSAAYYDKKAFGGKLNKLPAWTRDQALRGQTINAARWLKIDKDVGSLEVGKLADLIVLENDMMSKKTPDRLTGQNSILLTVVGGKIVYQSISARKELSATKSGLSPRSLQHPFDSLMAPGAIARDEILAEYANFNTHIKVGRDLRPQKEGEYTCGCPH